VITGFGTEFEVCGVEDQTYSRMVTHLIKVEQVPGGIPIARDWEYRCGELQVVPLNESETEFEIAELSGKVRVRRLPA
jgi:hypothetical protein